MAYRIRRVDYFYSTVDNEPGEGHELLTQLARLGINLVAFTAVPVGPTRTQLTLFPEDSGKMVEVAKRAGLPLDGPYRALLVLGDDELGALAGIHQKLHEADVHVYASTCVADGREYGYILYIGAEEFDRAVKALQV